MNIGKAKAIISQAKAEEIYEGPIPEDEEKAIAEAEKLVALARDAWSQHVRGSEVEAILRIADDEEPEEPKVDVEIIIDIDQEQEIVEEVVELDSGEPWPGYDAESVTLIKEKIVEYGQLLAGEELREYLRAVWEYESAGKARKSIFTLLDKLAESLPDDDAGNQDEEPDAVPNEDSTTDETVPLPEVENTVVVSEEQPIGDETYHAILEKVENELAADRKHIPEPPADDAPQLPWDWTKASDTEIQSLYSYYSLLAYHKSFVLIREDRVALECKRAADELANELLKASNKYDEKGKEKRVTILEAEIEADPHVANWRRLQRKHEAYVASARRERDSLYKLVESLSRFETMRQQEWQRSGQSNYR